MKKIFKILILGLIIIFLIFIFMVKINDTSEKKSVATKSKYEQFDFYNSKYKKRYESYHKKNPDLSTENVVTYVNIGLDNSFYTNTQKTPYLNKEYILVNKYLYLDSSYIPDNLENISVKYARSGMRLVKVAKDAFEKMASAALNDNRKIIAMSSYRSFQYQEQLYNRYVANDGVNAADTYSARPGFSEHQTGLCVDVYDGVIDYTNFEKTDSFIWMQDNAYKYGFILRYPDGKENITGYQYESWHYRYVGEKIAKYIHDKNITFDEYYAQKIDNKIKVQN